MKSNLILLIICCFSNLTSLSQKTTKLTCIAKDCRNKQIGLTIIPRINFFKLPEDTLAYTMEFLDSSYSILSVLDNPISIENVPVSTYRVEYRNIFSQKMKKIISLNNSSENTITICLDSLDKSLYKQNSLARLKQNDSIVIAFFAMHTNIESKKIVIKKQGSDFYASLYSLPGDYLPIEPERFKNVRLTKVNTLDFIRFENEIKKVNEKYCSLESNYKIISKYLNTTKKGGECQWNGFRALRYSFFK